MPQRLRSDVANTFLRNMKHVTVHEKIFFVPFFSCLTQKESEFRIPMMKRGNLPLKDGNDHQRVYSRKKGRRPSTKMTVTILYRRNLTRSRLHVCNTDNKLIEEISVSAWFLYNYNIGNDTEAEARYDSMHVLPNKSVYTGSLQKRNDNVRCNVGLKPSAPPWQWRYSYRSRTEPTVRRRFVFSIVRSCHESTKMTKTKIFIWSSAADEWRGPFMCKGGCYYLTNIRKRHRGGCNGYFSKNLAYRLVLLVYLPERADSFLSKT